MSQSISIEGGERKETEKSSGGEVAPWGVVAVMGELSNAPLSKLPSKQPCHHPGLIYGAVRSGTHISLRRVQGRVKGEKGRTVRVGCLA